MMYIIYVMCCFFFFKQKTAYEMRISDWSSDVCSSDLAVAHRIAMGCHGQMPPAPRRRGLYERISDRACLARGAGVAHLWRHQRDHDGADRDRKSVVEGKSVSVRVDLGGRRIITKKNKNEACVT